MLSRRICAPIRLAVVIFALCAGPAHAATDYWRVTTDRISAVCDRSAKKCERLAAQFVRLEQLMAELAGWESDFEPTPLAVFSISRQDARQYFLSAEDRRRQSEQQLQIYSKFLPGRDLNVAAIVSSGSEEPLQSALLLYAQNLIRVGPSRRHPAWFQIGVPNLLNGLVIRDDGSVLLNRGVIFEPQVEDKTPHVKKLNLERVLSMPPSELDSSNIRAYSLLAREWAMSGLLTTAERKNQYLELATLMRQGTPASDAIANAFGMSLEQLTKQFESRDWRSSVVYRLAPAARNAAIPAAVPLDEEQGRLQLEILQSVVEHTPMQPR